MVDLAREGIHKFCSKMKIPGNIDKWIESQNLTLKAANGEELIEVPYKFDRIIANLVLIHTEDPAKMLKNFQSMASENCLLGVSVWADQKKANLLPIIT